MGTMRKTYTGLCPLCGRRVSTTSDGVVRRNHAAVEYSKLQKNPDCLAWGFRALDIKEGLV